MGGWGRGGGEQVGLKAELGHVFAGREEGQRLERGLHAAHEAPYILQAPPYQSTLVFQFLYQ